MDWNVISAELRKPLDSRHVKPAKQYGPKGDYIEGWFAIAEANRIFGEGAWSYEIADLRLVSERDREIGPQKKPGFGVTYIARIVVTVGGVQREDVGAGHGYDVDCGLAHESAIKEAVTDALKRALRTFGNPFGLALYDKERAGVQDVAAEAKKQDDKAQKALGWAKDFAAKVAKSEGAMDAMQLVFDNAAALARLEAYPDALATVEAALEAHNVTMAIHEGRAVPTEGDLPGVSDGARMLAAGE